jgi:hypothetical protein
MATPDACSVRTGCAEVRAIRNQRIPLRFKIKNTEGDYGSLTGVEVYLRRQDTRTLGFEEPLTLHR